MRNPITKKPLLAREITITLIVKFLLIYCLWLWFFSHPIDKNLDSTQVQEAIFGAQTQSADLRKNTTPTASPEATTW